MDLLSFFMCYMLIFVFYYLENISDTHARASSTETRKHRVIKMGQIKFAGINDLRSVGETHFVFRTSIYKSVYLVHKERGNISEKKGD